MGDHLYNEGEAGFGTVEGFSTFDCVKEPRACSGAFLTPALAIRAHEVEVRGHRLLLDV
jgi:hypothetical protein